MVLTRTDSWGGGHSTPGEQWPQWAGGEHCGDGGGWIHQGGGTCYGEGVPGNHWPPYCLGREGTDRGTNSGTPFCQV
jgi:hypothetical protein